jgi:hypothetical protein
MLGFVAALGAELSSGESVVQQLSDAPGPILAVFFAFAVASLVPILKGANLKESLGPFTPSVSLPWPVMLSACKILFTDCDGQLASLQRRSMPDYCTPNKCSLVHGTGRTDMLSRRVQFVVVAVMGPPCSLQHVIEAFRSYSSWLAAVPSIRARTYVPMLTSTQMHTHTLALGTDYGTKSHTRCLMQQSYMPHGWQPRPHISLLQIPRLLFVAHKLLIFSTANTPSPPPARRLSSSTGVRLCSAWLQC